MDETSLSLSLSLILCEAAHAGEIVSAVTITTYPDGTETVEEISSQGFDYEAHLSDWRYDSEHAGMYTWVGSVSGRADGSQVSTSTWSVPELTFPTDAEMATMLSMKQGQTITEADIVAMREAAESSTTLDAPVVSESLEDWLAEPEDYSTWEVSVFLSVPISAGPRYADREQRIEQIEDVVYELADDLPLDAEVQPFLSMIGFKAWLTRTEVEDLLADPRVRKVSDSMEIPVPLATTLHLEEIRQHMQVSEIWDQALADPDQLYGTTPSAIYPGASRMVLAIADTPIDHDHPVFSNAAGTGSRLVHIYRVDEEFQTPPPAPYPNCTSPTVYHHRPDGVLPSGDPSATGAFVDMGGTGYEGSSPASGLQDESEHGTSVLGLASGSLDYGPSYPVEPVVSTQPYADDRTGVVPLASLVSIEAGQTFECSSGWRYYSNVFAEDAIDFLASSVSADVALMAFGNPLCQATDGINESANQVFLAGTLPVAAVGNVWGAPHVCQAHSPALAPGTLAVGALEPNAGWPAIEAGDVWRETWGAGSSRGGHSTTTRSIVDLVVPGGPWASCNAYDPATCPVPLDGIPTGSVRGIPAGGPGFVPDYHDNTSIIVGERLGFDETSPATSWATGITGGAMLLLREQYQLSFPTGALNEPGMIKTIALGMADNAVPTYPSDPAYNGHLIHGTTDANGPMDDLTGAGRLNLRRWNPGGLDEIEASNPAGATDGIIVFAALIPDGGIATIPINPYTVGGTTLNMPMPSDVDTLRASAFWFEPNYDRLLADQARIDLSLVDVTHGVSTGTPLGADNKARVSSATRWAPPAGSVYEVRLHGVSVPNSQHPDYYFNEPRRLVYVYVFWEDADRDDADGPSFTVE